MVLPLATVGALVLMLSSLSLLGTGLAGRLAQSAEIQRRQGDDALHSAAQLMVERLQTSHACLAQIPSSRWDPLPAACPATDGSIDVASLLQVGEGETASRLLAWLPGPGSARLRLQLVVAPAASQGVTEVGGRTGSFVLTIDPATARVLSLRREGA